MTGRHMPARAQWAIDVISSGGVPTVTGFFSMTNSMCT